MSDQSGELQKLKITRCSGGDGGNPVSLTSDLFQVMINPADFRRDHQINYHGGGDNYMHSRTLGTMGTNLKFASYNADIVQFELVFDDTGVINMKKRKSVADQITALKKIIYDYNGDNHEPNIIQLAWGSFVFFCRLSSLTINYTLFKPSGEPLRARLKLAFKQFMTVKEEVSRKNNHSPDLTHIIEVKAGDSLPLLCHRIYQESRYYPMVAAVNGLDNFRQLEPGTRLVFPPLNFGDGVAHG